MIIELIYILNASKNNHLTSKRTLKSTFTNKIRTFTNQSRKHLFKPKLTILDHLRNTTLLRDLKHKF